MLSYQEMLKEVNELSTSGNIVLFHGNFHIWLANNGLYYYRDTSFDSELIHLPHCKTGRESCLCYLSYPNRISFRSPSAVCDFVYFNRMKKSAKTKVSL
ncbi:hypothetical protein SAMN05443252_102404 [Bacillus sp. OV322]|jgi:hypothetical protein|uniref:hypothetical protein n=1 Tax=Bacillus sp. OV322 TaxID=1882764 RepID=UPI0008E1D403|nr:hypothetical protein [Bacillus sp. OV322]SFC25070.1 hypothetical protein SAMN05443252_102404 [Bacillus sp. OV322]